MSKNIIRKLCVIIFGLILAILLRIIITFTVKFSSFPITHNVTSYFAGLTSIISIVISLFWISNFIVAITADWIAAGYIPLLIYVLHWTNFKFSERLQDMTNSYDVFINDLTQKWFGYFNNNETYWPNLEKRLQCCGLEGPRSYMDYMQMVPKHCYNPELITLGCSHWFQNIYFPMQKIGFLLLRFALLIELSMLYFYAFRVFKKLLSLIGKRYLKKVFKPCL
ncbi:uncharacterized protein LOC108094364 isoform X1 [Drosophila ficusphila]|uniref:uncharacterized protein LOC108094364 isoform X1 n=1 Tax=Drosophila ficusphila TaxID=30025 RepID=UPI001C8A7903|nr:uncharacterized protein LOC108094364 isoform X1 [Drosophila ficusphila]